MRIAVVGGGISGLAAAHRIVEIAPDVRVELWEKTDRTGGVLSTKTEQGYQVEESADNFITTVPWGLDLCRRLGLEDQLVQTNPKSRQTCVVHRNRLYKLPDGFLMMAPTQMWPLAVTPLLTPWGKARAAMEYFIPPKKDAEDESMYDFGCRRMGREVFERLIEPLMSGVYGADMKKLSLLATMPRFRDMERDHGSMIRAMRFQMKQNKNKSKAAKASKGESSPQSGARYSMFVALRDGFASLVQTLVDRLPEGAVKTGRAVSEMRLTSGEGAENSENAGSKWQLTDEAGRTETFDAVILATPSGTAARLLKTVDEKLSARVGSIEHTGTAIVTVAYRRNQIGHKLDGAGFVVPAIENNPILAGSFSSVKYPHRAPSGDALIRIFAGGSRAPEMAVMPDGELVDELTEALRPLLHIDGEPHFVSVAHWPRTMPQYHVGHLDKIADIERRVADLPGLMLAGNAYHGVGVPACIHSGEKAAEHVLGYAAESNIAEAVYRQTAGEDEADRSRDEMPSSPEAEAD